ncbi:MAG: hypothetical protein AB1814_01365 [Thermodesulfobacteriota bacterium]
MPANNRPRPGRDLRERISARGSLSLAASVNYVINEWLDAAYDKFHPEKRVHYCVSGQIAGRGVTLEYILLVLASLMAVTLFVGLLMVVDMPWRHWFLHSPFKTK